MPALLVRIVIQFWGVVVVSYYTRIFALFGGKSRGGGINLIQFTQMDCAGTAQQGREVGCFAVLQQNFGMQFGQERRRRQTFFFGDAINNAPKCPFQPDAGALAIQAQTARDIFISTWALPREHLTHDKAPLDQTIGETGDPST